MRLLLTLLVGVLLSSCLNGQVKRTESSLASESVAITPEQAELIYSNTEAFPNNTQLSIAIIENGAVKFVGIERTDDSLKFVRNEQSIFEIGSISKVFTSTLLANFVQGNQLNLTDPIQSYFDFELKREDSISLQELANHTSGLPRLPSNLNFFTADLNNPYKQYDEQKLEAYFAEEMNLIHAPGTTYEYSNIGAGTLGFLLTKIAGSSYEELLQEKIFSTYGMANSTTNREQVQENIIKGQNPSGQVTSNWDFGVFVGAGGILSSTADLSKFALAQFDPDNQELILTHKPTFTVNEHLKIGLGWHILKRESGKELIWHNGGTGGYTSSMGLDTVNQNGVIILSNISAFHPAMGNIDKLVFELIETLRSK
jgi:CubicO group peptidase (beta-lactamase class C family)